MLKILLLIKNERNHMLECNVIRYAKAYVNLGAMERAYRILLSRSRGGYKIIINCDICA